VERAVVLALAVLAAPAWSQAQPAAAGGPVQETDAERTDLVDIWRRIRHAPPPEADDETPKRATVIAPVIGQNPTFGATFGAALQTTFVRGDPQTTRLSSGIASVSYSTKNQLLTSARFDAFMRENRWLVQGDNRFAISGQDTFGLGADTPPAAAVHAKYDFVRIHETVSRQIRRDVFAGVGFLFDSHTDVRPDTDDETWDRSAYVSYSASHGLDPASQQAAGGSLTLLIDKRDGQIDPRGGWMAATSYRMAFKGLLGGDSTWQLLHAELRSYHQLPGSRRPRLAFWLASDLSFGTVSYFELPATVNDMYGRSARGYREGRYRGERLAYGEAELRMPLTRNGLIGAVAFVNTTTVTNLEQDEHLFHAAAPSGGLGLRALLNKRSRTNVCVDIGWGKAGARGVYFAIQDAF
jgi:outer membrane protein assembly factor BamA